MSIIFLIFNNVDMIASSRTLSKLYYKIRSYITSKIESSWKSLIFDEFTKITEVCRMIIIIIIIILARINLANDAVLNLRYAIWVLISYKIS